jgi:DNA replication licensing factor MCM3
MNSLESSNVEESLDELDNERKFFVTKNKCNQDTILRPILSRKLVSYIRKRPVEPKQLTLEAQERIISFYTKLRSIHRDESNSPVTVRTLETIIRLATANAKLNLDHDDVTSDDVVVAEMILRASILGEKLNQKR